MHKGYLYIVASSILVICVAVAFAADWSTARKQYDTYKEEYDGLRKLTPQEARRLVTAVCEADEDERKAVAQESAERIAELVQGKYKALTALEQSTVAELSAVINDKNLTAHHDTAKAYRDQIKAWGKTIDRMTYSLRGKNHPAVRYTIEQGNKAHRDRQSSKECDVSEYALGQSRVDCIRASDCTVVELKPDNKRGVERGEIQAKNYTALLNDEEDERKKLATRNSDFKQCKKYKWEVWCYKLCPDIDEETGIMVEVEPQWRKCGP